MPTTTYPPYTNTGTTQPKFDARVDYDYPDGAKLSFSGGVAGTDGMMHSGIGPFDIKSGTVMGYGKANYSKKALRAAFFTNILHGDADQPARRAVQLRENRSRSRSTPEPTTSRPRTSRRSASTTSINYGGNLRFNTYDLEIAPQADNRTEFGAYVQDEIFLSDHFRLNLGARVDRFDYLDSLVFSPRTAFLIKPRENQTIRLSYNRAYRAPSVINNWLSTVDRSTRWICERSAARPIYALPVNIVGNTDLTEQSLDAYEIGYSGMLPNRAVISAAFYVNNVKEEILFTEDPTGRYTAANPPPNWPMQPSAGGHQLHLCGRTNPALDASRTRTLARYVQKGFELGVETRSTTTSMCLPTTRIRRRPIRRTSSSTS